MTVNPAVIPRAGDRHTDFKIAFTSRATLGEQLGDFWDYDVNAFHRGGHPEVGCFGGFGDELYRGRPGQRLVLVEPWNPLPGGGTGWCTGRYYATIQLVRSASCPHASFPGCGIPLQRTVVGHVTWLVRPSR